MRIVHVDASVSDRGGQVQLEWLAQRWHGSEMLVVVRPDAPLLPRLQRAGISVATVPFRRGLCGTSALEAIATRFGASGIAAHDRHAAVHASRLRWPWAAHRRVDFVPSPLGFHRYRRANGIIAVSATVARVLRNGGLERVVVVYDGVEQSLPTDTHRGGDLRRQLGIDASAPLVLAAGALVPHKGHQLLVEALSLLPTHHVAIAGVGPLGDELRATARAHHLESRLHLLGHRGDLPRWFATADVFAHPSVEEGLGQVVIEAMLSGIPTVVSQAGGLRELGAGIPFAPGCVCGLARAIAYASTLPRSEPPPSFASRFGVGRMVEDTLAAYRQFGLTGPLVDP